MCSKRNVGHTADSAPPTAHRRCRERASKTWQCLRQERLRLGQLALGLQQHSQVAHGGERARMLLTTAFNMKPVAHLAGAEGEGLERRSKAFELASLTVNVRPSSARLNW